MISGLGFRVRVYGLGYKGVSENSGSALEGTDKKEISVLGVHPRNPCFRV